MRKILLGMFALALVTTVVFAFALPNKPDAKAETEKEEPAQTECSDINKRWFVFNMTCAQQAALSPSALFAALTNPANYSGPQPNPPACNQATCACAIFACVSGSQPDFGPTTGRYRIYDELLAWVELGATHPDIRLKNQ